MSIKNQAKKMLKNIIPVKHHNKLIIIKNFLSDGYSTRSYSQEGEDMILRRIFEKQEKGIYVDVGAHHPKRFSNTYYFYKRGWRGINIDAMPGGIRIFNKLRPRDINLEIAISDKKEMIKYYIFNDPALNTFSKQLASQRDGQEDYRILFEKDLQTYTLVEVLDKYLPRGQRIDFLSIDVEGLELQAVQSNDWNKYRPRTVLVEQLLTSFEEVEKSRITQFMKSKGYSLYAKTVNSVFYLLL